MQYHPDLLKKDFSQYLIRHKLSQATVKYYVSDIRVFLRFIYQTTADYTVSSEMFESYENYLKAGKLPSKTINRKLSSLRVFNNYLQETGQLKDNVMTKVRNKPRSFQQPQLRLSSPLIFLILFLCIIAFGGLFFIRRQTVPQGFSLSTVTKTPISIPKSLQTSAIQNSEILRVQSLSNIDLENEVLTTDETSKSSVGRAVLPQGAMTKSIYGSSIQETSLVFITPTTGLKGNYFVTAHDGYFTVTVQEAQESEFSFNWMVLDNQLPIDNLPR